MKDQYRLAPDIQIDHIQSGMMVVRRELCTPVNLIGSEWALLIDAIGQGASLQSINEALEASFAPQRLYKMLAYLEEKLVIIGPGNALTSYGLKSTDAQQTKIQLHVFGFGIVKGIATQLNRFGIDIQEDAQTHLVFVDDYLTPELMQFNQERLSDNQPWLLVKLAGQEPRIGPLFIPETGPCWHCFASRQEGRRSYIERRENEPLCSELSGSQWAALGQAIIMLEKFILTGDPNPYSNIVRTFDIKLGSMRDHILIKRPQCPSCGDPDIAISRAIQPLVNNILSVTSDSGHRQVEPTITFERLVHHISPITGIGDALIEAHDDEHILCYGIIREDVRNIRTAQDLLKPTTVSSGLGWGKGLSHAQCRTSALCEAIERFTFSNERPADAVRASYETLGDAAIDPRSTMLFSAKQYEKAGSGTGHDRYPNKPFDTAEIIGWTEARSLTNGKLRYVASDQMWMTPMNSRDSDFCIADSNGCASGNSIEESILQGLLEIIERDALAIWWYNQLVMPCVDVSSFHPVLFANIQSHYIDKYGRDIWVIDVSSDLNIPVFVAVSARRDIGRPEFVAGFGCHLDPAIAINRAITEMGQIIIGWRPYLDIPQGPSPITAPESVEYWLRSVGEVDQPQMMGLQNTKRNSSDFPIITSGNIEKDIGICVDRLDSIGIEVIVADATRPDIGFPVTRVFAPGMRHFRPRFAAGRLYDVPIKQGYRTQKLSENDLNTINMVF